ncbi:MAG: acyltransferase domain-containing protein, partial [Gemmataceae bacterium]
MGRTLFDTQPMFRKTMQHCEELLRPYLPRPLTEVLFQDGEMLQRTQYTQPALFVVEYGLAQLWLSWGLSPDFVLGHSIGEYVAACVAGVFSLEDGLKLIAERGRLMGELPAGGAMAAILANAGKVRAAIEACANQVALAALNGPANTVISGDHCAVARVCAELERQSIRSIPLPVSHAFHSPLLEPMLDRFERLASSITPARPKVKLVSNLMGRFFADDEWSDAAYWREHARQPVRFAEGVEALANEGCDLLLEIGPQPVLTALAQSCLSAHPLIALPTLKRGVDDWSVLLDSLAQFYVAGAAVDWAAFDRDYPRRKVSLPTYPFQRERYWVEETKAVSRRPKDEGTHPLLGTGRQSAISGQHIFEIELCPRESAWLGEHRVHGAAVLPGAAYLEAASAAASQAGFGSRFAIEQVELRQALLLPEDSCLLQTVLTSGEDGSVEWRAYSRTSSDRNWTLHALGQLRPEQTPPEPGETLAQVRRRCSESVSIDRFYANFEQLGLDYGPNYQGLTQLFRGSDEALGLVRLPEKLSGERRLYRVHPVLLDACLQVCGGVVQASAIDEVYLPFSMERVQIHAEPVGPIWCWARLRPGSTAQAPVLDLQMFDVATERTVATVSGLHARRAERSTLQRARDAHIADWMCELVWEEKELSGGQVSAEFLTGPVTVAEGVRAQARDLLAEALTDHGQFAPVLEKAATAYVLQALKQLGVPAHVGQCFSSSELATNGRVLPRHHRLLQRLLDMLAEDGVLLQRGEVWEVLQPLPAPSVDDNLAALLNEPKAQLEATLVQRCGAQLAAVLRGQCEPLSLLFPGDAKFSAEQLYGQSAGSRAFHALMGQAIRAALAARPAARRLRVLEIGAGTGSTSACVLPLLPAEHCEYVFSDLSAGFFAPAKEKLAQHDFVDYRVLDIERDPLAQGFVAQGYDLVLAANVLHATADLRQALRHTRQLLAPEGILFLLEGTRRLRWIDLLFGLVEGWWKFRDTSLRPSHPLLPASSWRRLLAE